MIFAPDGFHTKLRKLGVEAVILAGGMNKNYVINNQAHSMEKKKRFRIFAHTRPEFSFFWARETNLPNLGNFAITFCKVL